MPDVDSDGREETVLVYPLGSYAAFQLLYLSNGACPKFAGVVVDGPLSPLSSGSGRILDLEATWSNGCAGNDYRWTRYRWNGLAYAVADTATCWLCSTFERGAPAPRGANTHQQCQAAGKRLEAGDVE